MAGELIPAVRGIAWEASNGVGKKKPLASSVIVSFTSCEYAMKNPLYNQQSASKTFAVPNVVWQILKELQPSKSGLARVLLDNKRTVRESSSFQLLKESKNFKTLSITGGDSKSTTVSA